MNVTKEQFVREVINRLAEEHEVSASEFEHLVPGIEEAYPTEGVAITPDELSSLVHGDGADAAPLTEKYPLIEAITLAPYTQQSVMDRSAQVEKEEEEMEEDDEEDDAEDEDDEDEESDDDD